MANITCTPKIKNDFEHIVIKNYIDQFPYFEHNFSFINNFNEFVLKLNDAKNLTDEINMQQKVINFNQFILNNIIFYKISQFSIKPASKNGIYYDYLPIFYDITSSSIEPVYYIPIEYCKTFADHIKSDITSDTLKVAGSKSGGNWSVLRYCVITKRDNLFQLVAPDSNIEYFPCHKKILDMLVTISENDYISYVNNLTNSFRKRQLNQFFESNEQINLIFSYFDIIDRRIQYSQIYDLGLIKIKAETNNNILKLTSNKDLVLHAK